MEELSTGTDNFVQSNENSQENQQFSSEVPVGDYDKNVMGEAVDAVQAKNKGFKKDQAPIQKFKIDDKEYTLDEIIKERKDLRKGMYSSFEKTAKLEKDNANYAKMLKYLNDKMESGEIVDLLYQNEKYRDKLDQSIQKYAERQIRWHQMTPEQQQMELERQRGMRAEEELKQYKQQESQEQQKLLEQHYINEYNIKFQDQIAKKGLPFHDLDIKEMAMTIAGGIGKGEDIDWESAAEQVINRRSKSFSSWMESLASKDPEGNLLVQYTPKSVLNAYRKYLANQVKQQARQPKPDAAQSYSPPVKQKTMTPQEWRQFMKTI